MAFRKRHNLPSYFRSYTLLQLSFGFLSVWFALMQLSWSILTQMRAVTQAQSVRISFTPMILVIFAILRFIWLY